MSDNVTPMRPGAPRTMTAAENDALQSINHARAIADAIYNGTTGLEDGSFLEELGPSSVNSLMHLLIEKLDAAIEQIERGPRN